MTISIFPPEQRHIRRIQTKFALHQDRWNDYSFQTQYHLYYRHPDEEAAVFIGTLCILRSGQTPEDGIQIQRAFESLDERFCSVGRSLDYYQRLNEMPPTDRDEILDALRDVVAIPKIRSDFQDEEGWSVSLFRDEPNVDGFLDDAEMILRGRFTALADVDFPFSFRAAGWTNDLDLEFSPDQTFSLTPDLPQRILVLIGRNGSGKSTLLARLARVGFASPAERANEELRSLGRFDPPTIGFPKIVAISYSAFDSFAVPGLTVRDLAQIARDIDSDRGRYVYAGLRDIAKELRNDLDARPEPHGDEDTILRDEDRNSSTELKTLDALADEFDRTVHAIAESGETPVLERVLQPLLRDPSLAELGGGPFTAIIDPSPCNAFLEWSTGHKIVFHVVASLVANVTHKTLVLFDEPEMHLHPPLIAALLRSVRILLDVRNALAVLATHSPVVVQETLAEHVRIVRRHGPSFEIARPTLQTFGQNVGALTHDTFGLTGSSSDFYDTLDQLTQYHSTIEEVNGHFDPPLSGQALSYAMARLARRSDR